MDANAPARSSGNSGFPNADSTDGLLSAALLAWRMLTYRLLCFSLNHMLPLKLAFALLRRVRPLAMVSGNMVVTKSEDVREVLARFDDFQLGKFIEPGMPWGPFIMTVDWREQHAIERRLLQSVVNTADDVRQIRSIVSEECCANIDAAMGAGRLNVVSQLAEPAVVAIAAQYFGAPVLGGDPARMADAMANLAGIIMANPPVGSKPWIESRSTISDVTTALLGQIHDRKAAIEATGGRTLPDDLLTRLVRVLREGQQPPWFGEDWIRRYMTGLIATGCATIVRATAHVMDQLLAHPQALRHAQNLATDARSKSGGCGNIREVAANRL